MSRHYVIGLGSGRCGTMSLADVLGLPHENSYMPWEFCQPFFDKAVEKAEEAGGDVGCYWLNYVEYMLQLHPDTKFVCLKRDREPTVRSWKRRMRGRSQFALFLMYVDADGYMRAPSIFPERFDLSMEEAAGFYWDEYYETAEKLQERYPQSFRIYWMGEVLNNRKRQEQMFRFAGLPPRLKTRRHKNKGGRKDPELGNILSDLAAKAIRENKITPGMRMTVTPEPDSRLTHLAVERKISKKLNEDIVFEFNAFLESPQPERI